MPWFCFCCSFLYEHSILSLTWIVSTQICTRAIYLNLNLLSWSIIQDKSIYTSYSAMQTKYRLYLVLDFVNGGHLFFQLYHHGLFRYPWSLNTIDHFRVYEDWGQLILKILFYFSREDLARIYAAEIVSAVAHLHTNGIMHRDLKPENILLDEDGHVLISLSLSLFVYACVFNVCFCVF